MQDAAIHTKGLTKAYGKLSVLKGVDLEVHPGKVTALVGDNGAGKSTLIKGLAGVQPYDEGEVLIDGQHRDLHTPRDAAHLGIEVVYQDLALCDNLDIVQNMFLGRERGKLGMLDEADMEQAARKTLTSLSVRTVKSVRTQVASLSGGQRQTVAIAKAVMWNSKVVILDEPTAALGVAQTRQVLDLVRRLADPHPDRRPRSSDERHDRTTRRAAVADVPGGCPLSLAHGRAERRIRATPERDERRQAA